MKEKDKPNKKNNFFRLVTKCSNCKKHITIDLILSIEECPQYGKPKKIEFEFLPKYIKNTLIGTQNTLDLMQNATDLKTRPICDDCYKIEKLKE